MALAPIAFFAYKRPDHTLKALTSLSQCKLAEESKLYIFCDAAKSPQDQESVQRVREVVRSQQWCKEVEIINRESNLGLANSIISATTSLCEQFGRVIVLEDDLIVSPYFLEYMNDALTLYESNPKVMQISGYMFPVDIESDSDAIFLPFPTTWGWATWQRSWKYFNRQMSGYEQLKKDKKLRKKFNLEGSYNYFKILKYQIEGKVDSWGIHWYLNVFMAGGLTLYPVQSLVKNVGFDGSGTNCIISSKFTAQISQYQILSMPKVSQIDYTNMNCLFQYLRQTNQSLNIVKIIKQKLKHLWKNIQDIQLKSDD